MVESVNADTFIEFLKEMRQIYKKFIMFLENLSAHRLPECPSTSSPEGDVILVYLPKYTPQLNPMEIQWRVLKNMLAERCFNNAEELAKSIRIPGRCLSSQANPADGLHDSVIRVFCTCDQDYFNAHSLPAYFFTPRPFPTSLGFARQLPSSLCTCNADKRHQLCVTWICTRVAKPEAKDA